jgi:hypothetical protein
MKKKIVTSIMLLFVAFIWGKIIYDIVTAKKESTVEFNNSNIDHETSELFLQVELIDLNLNYPDPFLKTSKKTQPVPKINSDTKKTKPNKSPDKEIQIKWPSIEYKGLIANAKGNSRGVFRWDGKDEVFAVGEEHMGISILKMWKDSVELKYQDVNKMLYK